jgi:protein-S-isoprenylcysteine O-methyltransferase Ste14
LISPTSCVAALWVVWLLAWGLAARSTAKTVRQESVASRLAYSVFIWGGAGLLFARRPLSPARPWIAWGGVAIVALGLCFTAWARLHLGRFWSATVTLKHEHALIRTGPYGLTRHPIYTGLLLALIGTAVVRDTVAGLAAFVLLVVGFVLKIRQEEQLLIGHFGSSYRAYQAEVPMLVPRAAATGGSRH